MQHELTYEPYDNVRLAPAGLCVQAQQVDHRVEQGGLAEHREDIMEQDALDREVLVALNRSPQDLFEARRLAQHLRVRCCRQKAGTGCSSFAACVSGSQHCQSSTPDRSRSVSNSSGLPESGADSWCHTYLGHATPKQRWPRHMRVQPCLPTATRVMGGSSKVHAAPLCEPPLRTT